jgi:hypothetical protein
MEVHQKRNPYEGWKKSASGVEEWLLIKTDI